MCRKYFGYVHQNFTFMFKSLPAIKCATFHFSSPMSGNGYSSKLLDLKLTSTSCSKGQLANKEQSQRNRFQYFSNNGSGYLEFGTFDSKYSNKKHNSASVVELSNIFVTTDEMVPSDILNHGGYCILKCEQSGLCWIQL